VAQAIVHGGGGHGELTRQHGGDGGEGHGDELEHAHPTSTGLNSVKMLMWTFIGSECMLFGSLIATYVADVGFGKGPGPKQVFEIPYTSVSAFVLLISSLTMVLALAACQQGNQRQLRIWLVATAALGLVFLGGQYFEFTTFKVEKGAWLDTNFFGSTFFTLTGFHGAHVTVGAIWLLSLWLYSLRKGIPASKSLFVEVAGLYWHFVDIVWIVIFTVVYLIPTSR
jgi:cytochrome c oxidase subunit 3/cytochrome o ubiquinol oxidase subunit 3